MTGFARPRSIDSADVVATFDSGEPALDEWLRSRAVRNERAGASRTFVVLPAAGGSVVAYHSLAAGSVALNGAGGRLRRNMPDPIPVVLLGRLAVDCSMQGQGLGAALLRDAVLRAQLAAGIIGARALVVDALSAAASAFYARFGFHVFPDSDRRLFLLIAEVDRIASA